MYLLPASGRTDFFGRRQANAAPDAKPAGFLVALLWKIFVVAGGARRRAAALSRRHHISPSGKQVFRHCSDGNFALTSVNLESSEFYLTIATSITICIDAPRARNALHKPPMQNLIFERPASEPSSGNFLSAARAQSLPPKSRPSLGNSRFRVPASKGFELRSIPNQLLVQSIKFSRFEDGFLRCAAELTDFRHICSFFLPLRGAPLPTVSPVNKVKFTKSTKAKNFFFAARLTEINFFLRCAASSTASTFKPTVLIQVHVFSAGLNFKAKTECAASNSRGLVILNDPRLPISVDPRP
ncbi:hypothetical protein R3P38DRAFT_2776895 [Favolaschia claudopus]|uniref:Uncharacterized protein n=1 Tax=Favolaschia claudopus TaxID=2862362 RepID=A0AAW0BNK2_9AGAR